MVSTLLFFIGAAVGSFLNVIALRYDPNEFLVTAKTVGGRSYCPHCRRTLRWFELIPIISFIVQAGRCRRCGVRVSLQYLIVEVLSGFLVLAVSHAHLLPFLLSGPRRAFLMVLWVAVFELLLLMSLIDIRLKIIPDEINVALGAIGLVIASLTPFSAAAGSSFFGSYALLFGGQSSILLNRSLAVAASLGLFGFLIAVTRGRGMGLGDLKLSIPLAIVFGWPDALLAAVLAFVLGAVFGLFLIARRKKAMKSFLPFGPFFALACLVVFFFGNDLLTVYFHLFGII